MAVLVEATTILVRGSAIDEKVVGGWETFKAALPSCDVSSDNELVGISLIEPAEVRQLADKLAALGLGFTWDGHFEDIAFADQKRGLITQCDWLVFETANIGIGGTPPEVAMCRLVNSQRHELRVPEGWRYQGSLTEQFGN
ncbi:hypothetical protein ELY33_01440 [Vreelandella andesensis]|uniref:Uncharacterized protein n=1 Tax=Vreelandella andesensis TaxID=447567 RepID=A0A3S0Y6V9_9GAMM|nr:hypothetical protein [Halomonas andesensis]RUR33928.1 hypothetical protein ELY33_01440 [Halomonas andesensis]